MTHIDLSLTKSYHGKRLTKLADRERTTLVIDPKKVGQQSTTMDLYKRTEAWLSKSVDPNATVLGPTREDFVEYVTKTGVRLSPVERNWLVDQANRTGAVDQEGELDYMVVCSDGQLVNTYDQDDSMPGAPTPKASDPRERSNEQVRRSDNPLTPYWSDDSVAGTYGPVRVLGQVTVRNVNIMGRVTRTASFYPGGMTKYAVQVKGAKAGGQATAAKTRKYTDAKAKRAAAKARAKAKAKEAGRILAEQRAKERELAKVGQATEVEWQ